MVALYDGIYQVNLNRLISVMFVAVDHTQPPPSFPADLDQITTREQARWRSLIEARYAVVPLPPSRGSADLGTLDVVEDPFGMAPPTRVLSVDPDEFNEFCRELETLSDDVGGIFDTKRCSAVSDYRVVEFLRKRIADADFLTASEKHLLGRGPAPWL
jgi:hypothetical protein